MSAKYDRTKVKKLVIHHLGDTKAGATTVSELTARANPYHYEWPEYDFGVLDNGTIVEMRPLTYIGSHCIANRQKYMYGNNWWNQNSIGVVLGIDATKHAPSSAMIEGLITLLVRLCKSQGMSIDDLYPHFQVCTTACPACNYTKLGLNTGLWNYDYVEAEVNKRLNTKATTPPPAPTPVTPPPSISNPSIETYRVIVDGVQQFATEFLDKAMDMVKDLINKGKGTKGIIQKKSDGKTVYEYTKPVVVTPPPEPVKVEPPKVEQPVTSPPAPKIETPVPPIPTVSVQPTETDYSTLGKFLYAFLKFIKSIFGTKG